MLRSLMGSEMCMRDRCEPDTGESVDGEPIVCEDEGDTCVDGVCGPPELCDGNACDDGDDCNDVEACDPDTGECVDGEPIVCEEEGDTCVDRVFVPQGSNEGNACDDGAGFNAAEMSVLDTQECGSVVLVLGDCVGHIRVSSFYSFSSSVLLSASIAAADS